MGLLRRRPRQETVVVYTEECPKCERPVLFLAGQKENVCAWCGVQIVRLGVE